MLPFLQLAEKYLTTQSKVVAQGLSIRQHEAIGLGAMLFAFAIDFTSTEDTPPTGIILGEDAEQILEAGMGYEGERGRGAAAFIRAGVVERLEGGLRVKGCDRYADAWGTRSSRSEKAKAAADARWSKHRPSMPQASPEHMRMHAGSNAQPMLGDAKTETETETETYVKDPQQQPAPVSEKPAPPPPSELAPDLEALETIRAKRFGTNPWPLPIPGFETLWLAVVLAHNGSKEYAFQTFANWLEDPWAKSRKPPGAVHLFLAPEQWPKHVKPRAQSPPETELEPGPWGDVLRLLAREGKGYAVTMLKRARLVELRGSTLRLAVPDKFWVDWVKEQYGQLLRDALAQVLGHEGAVEFVEQSEQVRGA